MEHSYFGERKPIARLESTCSRSRFSHFGVGAGVAKKKIVDSAILISCAGFPRLHRAAVKTGRWMAIILRNTNSKVQLILSGIQCFFMCHGPQNVIATYMGVNLYTFFGVRVPTMLKSVP